MLLPLPELVENYGIKATGVIHVGAHTAEEKPIYDRLGWPVLWVEANLELTIRLIDRGLSVEHAAIGERRGSADFYLTSLTGSSSLLEPNLNLTWRNDLKVDRIIKVPVTPLREIQSGQNFLNLDIQGGELAALKGADLGPLGYIYTEVHRVETYKNCPQVEEIDSYLSDFERVETKWTKRGWGDALFVRK